MEATVEDCRQTFKIGYESFEASRLEAAEAWNLYHNRHYTQEQLATLEKRGQPKETFNIVKMFARMLIGYFSTVVNTVVVKPRNPDDVTASVVLNDVINYILEQNRFDIEGDQIKLGGLISGIMCCITEVSDTGEKDVFGRAIYTCTVHHVPDYELVLDPLSELDDYSDAKYLHRFKWLTKGDVINLFGKNALKDMASYQNYTGEAEVDFDYKFDLMQHRPVSSGVASGFSGYYRYYDNFLVVHTVLESDDGRRWSIYWHNDKILKKNEITFKDVKWPYRVQKLHSSNKVEYYGLFREIIELQKAINQAIIQIQLMANTTKVFVQIDAVEDIERFKVLINRVNSVIPVLDMSGIRVEQLTKEIVDQYTLIDRALDRIQRILGINDSFLGMAYASDSGKKVKLQQNASIMSLRYIVSRIESFYQSLAMDIAYLVRQYYRANQYLRITDKITGLRWSEINKPMMVPTGNIDEQGEPEMRPVLLESIDPETGEPEVDEDGNLVFAPVSESGTDFEFHEFDIKIESSSYNDDEERERTMFESVMSGQVGVLMAQVNPSGFFKIASLAMQTMATRYSPEIAQILNETADQLGNNAQAQQQASIMAQQQAGKSG